ncbi:hypothetical protein EV421DRAFT_1896424 [Armillaria borealis]|uniref:Uncharacterized protein n=1 Tax=Armillaria borealis TaxID=47425 RepID=A0AA39N280_9AGAR|nr:hypothetical protein EV421DRAFT_1896424 [Armillaria borealis]
MPVSLTLEDEVVMDLCGTIPSLLFTLDCNHAAAGPLHALLLALTQKIARNEDGILSTSVAVNTKNSHVGMRPEHDQSRLGIPHSNPIKLETKQWRQEIAADAPSDCYTMAKRSRYTDRNGMSGRTPPFSHTTVENDEDDDATAVANSLPHTNSRLVTPLKSSRSDSSSVSFPTSALERTSPATTTVDNDEDDDATVVARSSPSIDSPLVTPLKSSRHNISSVIRVRSTNSGTHRLPESRSSYVIHDDSIGDATAPTGSCGTELDKNNDVCIHFERAEHHSICTGNSSGSNWDSGQRKSMRLQPRIQRDPDHGPDQPGDGAEFVGRGKGKCDKRKGNKKCKSLSYRSNACVGKNMIRQGKPTEGRPNWMDTMTLPPPNTSALQLLTKLSTVSSDSTSTTVLNDLIHHLVCTPCIALDCEDWSLAGIAACCHSLQKVDSFNNYKMMWLYFQYRKAAIADGGWGPSIADFAQMAKTECTMFQSWYSEGVRLLYLAAAGTPYIFFLLAAAGMHYDVCHPKYSSMEDISGLAVSLHRPESGTPSYKLVTCLIIACLQMTMETVNAVDTPWMKITLWNTAEKEWQEHLFSNHKFIQSVLDDVRVNGVHCQIAPVYTIHTKFKVPKNHCPFNADEAPAWTAAEHGKAALARPVTSLKHLEAELEHYYTDASEKKDPDRYLCIDTSICEGQTVVICDADAEPVAAIIPNMLSNLLHLRDSVVAQLQSTWNGEFEQDKSDHEGYRYYCWHGDWWNQYTERGYEVPKDANPYYTMREGRTTVHFQNIFQDIMKFVDEHIRKLLPDIYKELTVFMDHLPLNERSAAYLFSGFVINVRVATNGHRDSFDKIICVVVPFGEWEGGELCLYEAGHVLQLKPWDVVIFPSGRITHFNLHFTGLQGSLVLHSDNRGDSWASGQDEMAFEYNGWAHHVAR